MCRLQEPSSPVLASPHLRPQPVPLELIRLGSQTGNLHAFEIDAAIQDSPGSRLRDGEEEPQSFQAGRLTPVERAASTRSSAKSELSLSHGPRLV